MKFFKIFLAALLASVVSGILGFFIWLFVIFGMIGSLGSSTQTTLLPNSILKISLDEIFSEAPLTDPFSRIDLNSFEMLPSLTLLDALTAIEAAAVDDNIEGIYLCPSVNASVGAAALEELRAALMQFKECGKFVIAYNDIYSQGGYYLSSVADKIYAQPEGMIMWQGVAANTTFYKGLFDKLDISVDVFRPTSCRYKSAVEPFIAKKMSSENRAQMQQLVGSIWSTMAHDVALSRGLPVEDVNRIADDLGCLDVDQALKNRMIDGLIYEDQLLEIFRTAGANIPDEEINYIELGEYASLRSFTPQNIGASRVGIIYAEGSIYDGQGYDDNVYGDVLAARIRKARLDNKVKTVVLRVNSPGGSALASDVIWRELVLLQQAKPLVVSMGSYAASGGYYISAPADIILANRLTITGSIGVFGMKLNLEDALRSKLAVSFDGVETNKNANFMRSLDKMSPYEKQVMRRSVDKVYDHFAELVSQGRNLPLDQVLDIAQGRVWSGQDAVELGLADSVGGLREAISVAITTAGIEDNYRIVELLDDPTGFAAMFSGLQVKISSFARSKITPLAGDYQRILDDLAPLNTEHGLLMYSPYSVEL